MVRIFPAFSRIRTEYGEILYLSVFSPNVGRCGKNTDQNNAEYGHLLHSLFCSFKDKQMTIFGYCF